MTFYSENSPVWDRIGFWIHATVYLTLNILIPLAIIVLTANLMVDQAMSPYVQVASKYAITCFLSSCRAMILAPRLIGGSYQWYKKRHNNQVQEQSVDANENQEPKPMVPFTDF